MKRANVAAIGAAALGAAGAAVATALVASRGRGLLERGLPHETLYRKAAEMEYRPVSGAERASRAILWGQPDSGAFAAFTRLAPGARYPLHKHTHDFLLVVLEGTFLYEKEGVSRRVGERECIFIPGGDVFRSGSDNLKGCLFFELGSGSFDLQMVE